MGFAVMITNKTVDEEFLLIGYWLLCSQKKKKGEKGTIKMY